LLCQVNAILCTAGAAALKVRGELPGQSARGRDAANPCGSLQNVSQRAVFVWGAILDHTVLQDGVVALDCHCAGILVVSSVSRVVGESLVRSGVKDLNTARLIKCGPKNLGTCEPAIPEGLNWKSNI
jgi:hypothetical protein